MSERKIRVTCSTGHWFDMDEPPGFELSQYVTSVRATGFMLNDRMYVPHEHVVSIFIYDVDNPPAEPARPQGSVLQ